MKVIRAESPACATQCVNRRCKLWFFIDVVKACCFAWVDLLHYEQQRDALNNKRCDADCDVEAFAEAKGHGLHLPEVSCLLHKAFAGRVHSSTSKIKRPMEPSMLWIQPMPLPETENIGFQQANVLQD